MQVSPFLNTGGEPPAGRARDPDYATAKDNAPDFAYRYFVYWERQINTYNSSLSPKVIPSRSRPEVLWSIVRPGVTRYGASSRPCLGGGHMSLVPTDGGRE